jgi:hypothetical protein
LAGSISEPAILIDIALGVLLTERIYYLNDYLSCVLDALQVIARLSRRLSSHTHDFAQGNMISSIVAPALELGDTLRVEVGFQAVSWGKIDTGYVQVRRTNQRDKIRTTSKIMFFEYQRRLSGVLNNTRRLWTWQRVCAKEHHRYTFLTTGSEGKASLKIIIDLRKKVGVP